MFGLIITFIGGIIVGCICMYVAIIYVDTETEKEDWQDSLDRTLREHGEYDKFAPNNFISEDE